MNALSVLFQPNHFWRRSWDIVIILTALVYTALRVPLAIAFDIDEFAEIDVYFILNRAVDFIFITDMILICLTAHQSGRHMVTDHKRIIVNYLKSWFILDLLVCLSSA